MHSIASKLFAIANFGSVFYQTFTNVFYLFHVFYVFNVFFIFMWTFITSWFEDLKVNCVTVYYLALQTYNACWVLQKLLSSICSIVLRGKVSERPAWKDESWALLETDCDWWTGSCTVLCLAVYVVLTTHVRYCDGLVIAIGPVWLKLYPASTHARSQGRTTRKHNASHTPIGGEGIIKK